MGISEAEKFGLNRMVGGFSQMSKALPTFVNVDAEMALLKSEIDALKPLLPVDGDELFASEDLTEITTQQQQVSPFVNGVAGANFPMFNVPNIPQGFRVGISKVLSGCLTFNKFGDEGDRQLTKIGEALKVLAMKLIVNCGDETVIDFYIGMGSKL